MVVLDPRKWGQMSREQLKGKVQADTHEGSPTVRTLEAPASTASLYRKFPVETPVTAMDLDVFTFFLVLW